MELKYKAMINALADIEDERRIPEDVLLDALKEALAKAWKKDSGILGDLNVEAEINEKDETIDIYQLFNVVDNVQDDALEMDLETARQYKPDAKLGDVVREKVEFHPMSRAAATLAKNVMKQKIREAEKLAVYNAYIDQKDEMVLGVVESVKDRFALVNLGKATALMRKKDQIPGEYLRVGQQIRVVIIEVNKDSKGSQVLVSRADKMLVKRLFEKEVPEIASGVVEIKAIARDPGERTKMAVVSYNPDIDPIGACIGPRGSRVQEIIEELHGEKIDIFQWSDDITQLVRNALAPAEIKAVLPGDKDRSLLVIVDEDQQSLAIGKKGKNARLAVKLTGCNIDIKTKQEIIEKGMDYDALLKQAEELHAQKEQERAEKAAKKAEAKAAETRSSLSAAAEEARKKALDEVAEAIKNEDLMSSEMQDAMNEKITNDIINSSEEKPAEEASAEPAKAEEAVKEETPAEVEKPAEEEELSAAPAEKEKAEETPEPVKEEKKEEPAKAAPVKKADVKQADTKKRKADLEEMASQNTYVSVFEKLADTSKPKQQAPVHKRRKKNEEDNYKVRNEDLLKQLKEKGAKADIKPVYTQEELDEIEREQEEEEDSKYDIDYDEYEDYYKDDESK